MQMEIKKDILIKKKKEKKKEKKKRDGECEITNQ